MKKASLLLILLIFTLLLSGTAAAEEPDGAAPDGNPVSAEKKDAERPENGLIIEPGALAYDIYYDGTSLAQYTREEAEVFILEPFSNVMNTRFRVQAGTDTALYAEASAETLGFGITGSDLDALFASATVPEGSVFERYCFAKDLQNQPIEIDYSLSYDSEKITEWFENAVSSWTAEPVDASVSSLSGDLVVTPGKEGRSYDVTKGLALLFEDLSNFNIPAGSIYFIETEEIITDPTVTTEHAASYSILGSFTTYYAAPETTVLANREQNLAQSIGNMCGRTFEDGEVISALEMYGPVDYAHGFKDAGTIQGGKHIDQVGGGICQTTTTLYNACLYAELEIVYRDNHSMPVTYVSPSRDAMVYAAGNQDFKARNNTGNPITIESYIDRERHSITVNILGIENHPAGHSVEYESEVLELSLPPITVIADPKKIIGWGSLKYKISTVSQDGATCNIVSRLWKVTTDNGVKKRELFTGIDRYQGQGATYASSADLILEFTTDGSYSAGFINIGATFLDGETSFAVNPYAWEDEEKIAFNETMAALMEEYNLANGTDYVWPDSGTDISFYNGPSSETDPVEATP